MMTPIRGVILLSSPSIPCLDREPESSTDEYGTSEESKLSKSLTPVQKQLQIPCRSKYSYSASEETSSDSICTHGKDKAVITNRSMNTVSEKPRATACLQVLSLTKYLRQACYNQAQNRRKTFKASRKIYCTICLREFLNND